MNSVSKYPADGSWTLGDKEMPAVDSTTNMYGDTPVILKSRTYCWGTQYSKS